MEIDTRFDDRSGYLDFLGVDIGTCSDQVLNNFFTAQHYGIVQRCLVISIDEIDVCIVLYQHVDDAIVFYQNFCHNNSEAFDKW